MTTTKVTREEIFNAVSGMMIVFFLVVFGLVLYGNGGTEDLATFHKWLTQLIDNPLADAYNRNIGDYPPLFIFSFYPAVFLDPAIGLWGVIYLSLLLNLLVATGLIYLLTKNVGISLAFYFASFLSAMILKYTDINFMPTLLLSLWALSRKRFLLFAFFYSIACLIKWQPMILAPFFLVYLLHEMRNHRGSGFSFTLENPLLAAATGALAVFSATVLYFGPTGIIRAFSSVANEAWLSGYALNMHWLTTYYLHTTHPDQYGALVNGVSNYIMPGLRFISLAKIPFFIVYALTLYAFSQTPKTYINLLKFCLAGYFSYFMLNTGVHENHLFIAMVFALLLAAHEKRYQGLAGAMIITLNLNLLVFEGFGRFNLITQRIIWIDVSLPLAILFFIFWLVYWFTEVAPALNKNNSPG